MKRSSLLLALLLAATTVGAGCNLRTSGAGNTRVARGELYKPGVAAYDEFFANVHTLQVEAKATDDGVARQDSERALGLVPNTAADRTLEVLRERVQELKRAGAAFSVAGNVVTGSGGTGEAGRLATGASSSIAAHRATVQKTLKLPERADALLAREATLEANVEREVLPLSRAKQVKEELLAAKDVLGKLREESGARAKATDRYADDVAAAFTAQVSAPPPVASTTSKPKGGTPPRPVGTGTPPAGTTAPPPATTPSTPPPPPPKPDDFNP